MESLGFFRTQPFDLFIDDFGERGVNAKNVATDAAGKLKHIWHRTQPWDEHLADQLLLPLALAGSGSFTATSLNLHALTNMHAIRQFLPMRFDVQEGNGFSRMSVHRD